VLVILLISNLPNSKKIVDTIGKDTLKSIAVAGPDMQERLLGGLGLKSFSLSGAGSPLNMFAQ